jgi:uncharacterized OsmC-like protein
MTRGGSLADWIVRACQAVGMLAERHVRMLRPADADPCASVIVAVCEGRIVLRRRPVDMRGRAAASLEVRGVSVRGRLSAATREAAMDSNQLRAVQQPLKDAYRENPDEAIVTLRAHGQLGDQAISCSVATGQALAVAGLHPASGGDGSLACSGDMLLQALVACAGVTLRAVATSLQVPVAGGTVSAEGDLDFRGTLAVSKDAPVGFKSIRLSFDLDTDASAGQLESLLRLTERYCVVYQTLAHPAEMTVSGTTASTASRPRAAR